jgi:hypothetical protein
MKELLAYLKEEVDDPSLSSDFRRSIDERWWSTAHGPSIAKATSESMFNVITENFAKKIAILYKKKSNDHA